MSSISIPQASGPESAASAKLSTTPIHQAPTSAAAESPFASLNTAAGSNSGASTPAVASTTVSSPKSSPEIKLDSTLQTVIIQYRDATGQATFQVPSKEAVRLYELNQESQNQVAQAGSGASGDNGHSKTGA